VSKIRCKSVTDSISKLQLQYATNVPLPNNPLILAALIRFVCHLFS